VFDRSKESTVAMDEKDKRWAGEYRPVFQKHAERRFEA
jgi:hypothetical protein